jgi:hypothetical protein
MGLVTTCHIKFGYAVTLRACSMRCRYLSVAWKGWYGYGLGRSGRATWHVTTARSSRLLYIHGVSGSRNKQGTPWCEVRWIMLRHEARRGFLYRNSVSCQSLATLRHYGKVTSVYPPKAWDSYRIVYRWSRDKAVGIAKRHSLEISSLEPWWK